MVNEFTLCKKNKTGNNMKLCNTHYKYIVKVFLTTVVCGIGISMIINDIFNRGSNFWTGAMLLVDTIVLWLPPSKWLMYQVPKDHHVKEKEY